MKIRLLVLCLFCMSCDSSESVNTADIECAERADDDTGFLKPICEYIVTNFDSYDVDPNTLSIRTVDYEDVRATVRLSCCFSGDTAVMNANDKRVIDFQLGAK